MGTRADFYVGRGPEAEWLGSIAWDGYPAGIDRPVLAATTEPEFRSEVAAFVGRESSGTTPEMGWPWPWDDSGTTDYAYAFDSDRVYASGFGHRWFAVDMDADGFGEDEDDESDNSAIFPDMSSKRAVTYGPRSGVIVVGRTQ